MPGQTSSRFYKTIYLCAQAFRCRSGRDVKKVAQGFAADDGNARKSSTKSALESPRQTRPNKRARCEVVKPEVSTPTKIEQDLSFSAAASEAEEAASASIELKEEGSSQAAAAVETVSSIRLSPTAGEGVLVTPSAAAAGETFVLSAASLRARGRQKIPLENAKGLPERLGNMPLRLIVGGNNPSDHAW